MYEDGFDSPTQSRDEMMSVISGYVTGYMNKVFSKMCIGIFITFAAALGLNVSGVLMSISYNAFLGVVIGQLILVLIMNVFVSNPNISKGIIDLCYAGYCMLTGVTVGVLLAVFSAESVISALLASSLLFAALAFVGYTTKKNLSSIGSVCIAGLITCIILTLVNLFIFKIASFDIFIDIAVVIIFCGLIMYDVQKLKAVFVTAALASGFASDDEKLQHQFVGKLAVLGAFTLYLDFINIFIRLLSLFGKRR